MLADQEADHVMASGEDQTIARQSVVYLYQRAGTGWKWCESRLTPVEANQFKVPGSHFALDQVSGRCEPTQSVVPDATGAEMNPFSNP
jgi:hypothetical protein